MQWFLTKLVNLNRRQPFGWASTPSTHRREVTRYRLASVPAVGLKIGPVHSPHHAACGQLCHSNDTGVGQIHRLIGVFRSQGEHARHLPRKVEIQDQIATGNQRQHRRRIGEKTAGFRQDRVAGEKWAMPPKRVCCPWVERIIHGQQGNDYARISDGSRRSNATAASAFPARVGLWRIRRQAETPPPNPRRQIVAVIWRLNLPGLVRSGYVTSPVQAKLNRTCFCFCQQVRGNPHGENF